jgi:hypothetical protein
MVRSEDIFINGEEATWSINLVAPFAGSYQGTFRFRCYLSPMGVIQADRDYRKLMGDNAALADPRGRELGLFFGSAKIQNN